METDAQIEETKIKVFICRNDVEPILIHQLTARGQDEFRALLGHLELFAEFLPYLAQAEKKMNEMKAGIKEGIKEGFQLRVTLENLKTAIELCHTSGYLQGEPQ